MRTLPREPFRGGQICGWQTNVGGWSTGEPAYCGERKMDGAYHCPEHEADIRANYGARYRMAPGNTRGDFTQAVQLLWEPDGDPSVPVEPSAAERASYEDA